MLKPTHDNWYKRHFMRGANSDVDPNELPDGLYTDAFNMRMAGTDGNSGSLKRIGGERLRYNNSTLPGADTFHCLNLVSVKGHVVEFWASDEPLNYAPLIIVDGILSAQSFGIPYTWNRPHQSATVVECKRAGVIYPADHNAPPLFWDVQSLIDNQGTGYYFAGFNIDLVTVGLNTPPLIIWLNELEPLIDRTGPIGLSVGQYSYSARLKDQNGNATNWGPETNLFTVPQKYTPEFIYNGAASNYPGGRTFGGPTNLQVPTQFALNMEMRVDNQMGFTQIEVKRRRFNDGAGITGAGIEEIIARIPIVAGQLEIISFCDNIDANITPETVAPLESTTLLLNIKKPKGVEYANNRLSYINFEIDPQPTGMVFREVDGRKATSITKKLIKRDSGQDIPDGYANTYHSGHFTSYQRGEVNGFGYQFFDTTMGKWFATDIPGLENYRHPNRRDIKGVNGNWGADSLTYSDDRVDGANVNVTGLAPEGPVGATFEIMTQGTGAKTNCHTVVNPSLPTGGYVPGTDVGRPQSSFDAYAGTFPNSVLLAGPPFDFYYPKVVGGYQPWDPHNNQAGYGFYNVPPNVQRLIGPASSIGPVLDQNFFGAPEDAKGQIFAPTYQALGTLLYGMENIPASVSCFSVLRTERAGRVIMQGLLSPMLSSSQFSPATKSTTTGNFFSPDVAAGLVPQATLDDMQQNPGNYRAQIVAGFGAYTEHYGYSGEAFAPWTGIPSIGAHLLDMIQYARIMEDHGQVNVGEPPPGGMGAQPAFGNPAPAGNYVTQDKWRRSGAMSPIPNPGSVNYSFLWQWDQTNPGDGGNAIFDVASFNPVTHGRSNFFRLGMNQTIYAPGAFSTNGETAFDNPAVRDFHQPYYVVNIIKVNAQVPASNETPYKTTGMTIGTKTCIGAYSTEVNTFRLLGPREWHDCSNYLPTDYRFAYVVTPNLGERRWMCVTGNTQINIAAILIDIINFGSWIAPDGGNVYGLYDHVFVNGIQHALQFGAYGPPPANSRIYIKYDYNAPIHTFGGDTTIGPITHCVHDALAVRDNVAPNNGVNTTDALMLGGLGMPHAGFLLNPRYFMPEKDNQTEEQIFVNYLVSVRQWCIMWDMESRVHPSMYVNLNSTVDTRNSASQMFPYVHYVIRPYNFSGGSQTLPPAGFFPQYQVDYPLEWDIFGYGGIRFQPGLNLDYAKDELVTSKGFPKSGYVYKTDFCQGVVASDEFAPAQQDNPGLRTFSPLNLKVLSEETGEGKVIHSLTDGTIGQNMYFWTQTGWGYILTNKRLLTGVSGEVIGTQPIDTYWGDVVFLSREHGMPDELWRLHGKGPALLGNQLVDSVFWADREGAYRGYGTTFTPIAEDKFLKRLLPALQVIGDEYAEQVTGILDTTKNEYLMSMHPTERADTPQHPFVYSAKRGEWVGTFGHEFERFVVHQGQLLGARGLQTFTLDDPNSVEQSGVSMTGWGEVPFAPEPGIRFDAVMFRVHPTKPDRIELYDNQHNLVWWTDQATQEALSPGTGNLYVLRVDGWQHLVGKSNPGVYPIRQPIQDELFFMRSIYRSAERGILTDAQLQLQKLD